MRKGKKDIALRFGEDNFMKLEFLIWHEYVCFHQSRSCR